MIYQIPYNYEYSRQVKDFINERLDVIHTIYFGFASASRATILNSKSIEEHVECLREFKNKGVQLAYVINQVIDFTELDEYDKYFLNSDLVDIVILSQDKAFECIYEKYGDKFTYEASRFYFYLKENSGTLLEKSSIIAFGFREELDKHWDKIKEINPNIKISFISNENCYSRCDMKIAHNENQNLRNNGVDIPKFNCPYINKRHFYSEEEVQSVCEAYPVEIIKVCDRAFNDAILLEHLRKWVK